MRSHSSYKVDYDYLSLWLYLTEWWYWKGGSAFPKASIKRVTGHLNIITKTNFTHFNAPLTFLFVFLGDVLVKLEGEDSGFQGFLSK